jgi:hypothetical protein
MTPLELFFAILPPLIVGVAMALFNRKTSKRDRYADSLAEAKQKSDHIQLNLNLATAQLSYAVAMAIKRGKPNGEIEEGIKQYEKALADFRAFERRQVARLDTKH